MTPSAGDLIRCARGGALKLVTRVTVDFPGEFDRPTQEWARGELLRIECRVICPMTGRFLHDTHYSRLEYAPSGNLREQNDPPPGHWAHIGEIVVVERPALKQSPLF